MNATLNKPKGIAVVYLGIIQRLMKDMKHMKRHYVIFMEDRASIVILKMVWRKYAKKNVCRDAMR